VDVGHPLLALDLVCPDLRLVVVLAVEDDLAAVALGRLHLRDRRVFGHHDERVHARPRRRQRDALGVVAGARGDDARRPVLLRQRGDPVERATDLERARPLEVLELQVDLGAGSLGEPG
jgi:hypothetical protein